MNKKVIFIVNPKSGTHDKDSIVKLIPETFEPSQFDWKVRYVERVGHAAELAEDAVKHHADIVVAVGGDGTVNGVASKLVGTKTALGIVPCGSGNGLARHLQIPMNIEGALAVIHDGYTIHADSCCINGRPFFCTCGVGFDAYVSDRFNSAGKRGLWTYAEQMIQIGRTYKSETYEIEIDGITHTQKAFLVACGNASQYGNNVFIAPKASLTDGLMDITIMEPFKKVVAPQVIYQMMNQTLDERDDVHTHKCRHVVIRRQKAGVIHFDGDPAEEGTVLDISILPHSIYMVCGQKQIYGSNILKNAINEISGKIGNDMRENNRRIMRINKDLLGLLKR